jgi:NTP pyrophosphatase (non-canonical NTP hydrolase)
MMLSEIKARVENKTYTPSDIDWLIERLEAEQALSLGVTFSDYQKQSARTIPDNVSQVEILTAAVGLCGEAGEAADYVKKMVSHGHAANKQTLAGEIGDVLWYCAALCTYYDIDLGSAALQNIWKLKQRYPHGFSEEASRGRKDAD